ncbi:RNA-directed DNA polymerase, eukaryota [Tanacetum coccineum]
MLYRGFGGIQLMFWFGSKFEEDHCFLCNVNVVLKKEILKILPFKEGKLPVRYLGVQLVTRKINVTDCNCLIDKKRECSFTIRRVWKDLREDKDKAERNRMIFHNISKTCENISGEIIKTVRLKLFSVKLKGSKDVKEVATKWKIQWKDICDKWVWTGGGSSSFKVCNFVKSIENHSLREYLIEERLDLVEFRPAKFSISDIALGNAAQGPDNQNEVPLMAKATSSDPFNIYGMLNKRTKKGKASKSDSSVPYPPGFTPALNVKANNKETDPVEYNHLSGKSENSNSKVLEEGEMSANSAPHVNSSAVSKSKEGGSILEILEEMITVGQTMGFSMEGCVKDMEKIIGTQGELGETKMENISTLDAKYLWGNYCFDHIVSEACGNSGGIICIWDTNMFKKDNHIISDNFVALYGTWIPNNMKLLLISVYAPQVRSSKRLLWNYLSSLIIRWKGECLVMGDFNEVRSIDERWGSTFNKQGADLFNSFISSSGLIDIQMEGYSFTWAHPSASKMSKLDRFLLSNGLLSFFPHLSAVCLDRHLSDHRPILLKEVHSDFGPTPFRFFHSWLDLPGFDEMISSSWASFNLDDSNAMIRFKKKLKLLKVEIRKWTKDFKEKQEGQSRDLNLKLRDIDKTLDQGGVTDDLLLSRMELMKQIQDIHKSKHRDSMQKAKVRWAIEGDENSKYFHAIINKKRANLSVKGVMVDGDWVVDPILVKKEFRDHFADRFQDPGPRKGRINFQFPNRLSSEQVADLETRISTDEIRSAVWGCGVDKSPGPDGFTFDFFRKYWTVVGTDFCSAVLWFFDHGEFAIGCNSSFVALIPKILDPKRVCDYRPISLIGCLYKVVTKILASRLSTVISDLISDVQSAFLPNRQILDGPFIINEVLARCKVKKQQAMIFKVDFAKAYDSIRWDFLEDVLTSFGFGPQWCSWIRGSLKSGKSSILVNGSPTTEFHLFRGLKQGDPIAPFLFLLIMEAFHLSFNRAVEAGTFKGYKFDSSFTLSHLFYADDAVFIGEWSQDNLKGIMHILRCFSILSGMTINFQKSQLLGVGICDNHVIEAAKFIGCSTMKTPFRYLGILVGDNMANLKAWDETIAKMIKRLSKWKLNTLSIGGRLTLLKSVLGSTPIYNMSIYKVPKLVLNHMERLRRDFFYGVKDGDRKIAWIKWTKVLASKKFGGLGVSSLFALNRALIFKWVWRFLSHDNSLWSRVIAAVHGSSSHPISAAYNSPWGTIIKEVKALNDKGINLVSHCKIRVGNGLRTSFWNDLWIGDNQLKLSFPRLFALEVNKDCSVADKLNAPFTASFRRQTRGGPEAQQLEQLTNLLDSVSLSNMEDRCFWDLNGEGVFQVKDVRSVLDETFLPKENIPTRWVKSIPIKVNVFVWKLVQDRGIDHLRVHPRFLHSNATSHKWVLGAFAELLDNSLDEVCNGATYVKIDMLTNKKDDSRMLLIEDNGGGMDPEKMRHCMSLGYSLKSKVEDTIGQYGNGFKTSTMRLGADVIVFSRCSGKDGKRATQSIGLLSYTFLRCTGKKDIVVPMLDYERPAKEWKKMKRVSADDWDKNVEAMVEWSPFSSEADLLRQVIYLLFLTASMNIETSMKSTSPYGEDQTPNTSKSR